MQRVALTQHLRPPRQPGCLSVPLPSHTSTFSQAHQDQRPPLHQNPVSIPAPRGALERKATPPPKRPQPAPGTEAPPRVHPPRPQRRRRSNRSGTYCASAGRLPRPLSPRLRWVRRLRRPAVSVQARARAPAASPAGSGGPRRAVRAARSGAVILRPVEAPREELAVTRASRTTPPARPAPGGGQGRGLRGALSGAQRGARASAMHRSGTGEAHSSQLGQRPPHTLSLQPKYFLRKDAPAASQLPALPSTPSSASAWPRDRSRRRGRDRFPILRQLSAAKAGRWARHCCLIHPHPGHQGD